jgi:hypothetical protein
MRRAVETIGATISAAMDGKNGAEIKPLLAPPTPRVLGRG